MLMIFDNSCSLPENFKRNNYLNAVVLGTVKSEEDWHVYRFDTSWKN